MVHKMCNSCNVTPGVTWTHLIYIYIYQYEVSIDMIYILCRECGIICIPYGQIYTYEYKNVMQLRSIKKPSIVGDEVQFRQSNWMCPDGSNPSSGCLCKWEGYSFRNGHRCGACHNVSDAQVRTKKYNIRWERILKWQ